METFKSVFILKNQIFHDLNCNMLENRFLDISFFMGKKLGTKKRPLQ